MNGKQYLQKIKKELSAGHYQHKKGMSILAAFGYSRRRQAVIREINKELESLGLIANPPIDENMPLNSSHIGFFLKENSISEEQQKELIDEADTDEDDDVDVIVEAPFPAFRVGELSSASKEVCRVKQTGNLETAYTIMCMNKYSQLVVADTDKPLATAIKGIITYQSITDALLGGKEKTIIDCLSKNVPQVSIDGEIGEVIRYLEENDVVLVIGPDKRLSGIITAWDLAVEFADLVGPFKWIGEIEARLRKLISINLEQADFCNLLSTTIQTKEIESEMLTIGDLVRILENHDCWEKVGFAFNREVFIEELGKVREARNRLMHFRDPLKQEEKIQIRNFCDLVRRIPINKPDIA